VDSQLTDLTSIIDRADARLRAGSAGARVWPTGFPMLDTVLGGGLRSGGLALLAGPQGLGKTTFALQVTRNLVKLGRPAIYFSYEHEPEDLMQRLITLEAAEMFGHGSPGQDKIRAAFEDHRISASVEERLAHLPGALDSLKAVRDYSDLLHLHRSSGATTSLQEIKDAVALIIQSTGQVPFVVVDYLQKVKVSGGLGEDDRTSVIVEGLKDYAMDVELPVMAVVASIQTGGEGNKRVRIGHLRGSSSLGYEADVVLILNNKYDIVARHHLVYDVGNAERFRQWVVISVEKNRSGKGGIDLEFRKRLDQCRFETDGNMVAEQLVDERVFTE
jgi:replicative DNA helicase